MLGSTPGVWCTEKEGHDRDDPYGPPHRDTTGRRRWRNAGQALPRRLTPEGEVTFAAMAVAATSVVCAVTPDEILGWSRVRHIALARHIATTVIRWETGLSLPQIADLIGREDHTTVLNSVRRVEGDAVLRARALRVAAMVTGDPQPVDDPVGNR